MKNFIEKLANPKVIFMTFGAFLVLCVFANTLFRQDFAYLTQTNKYTPEQAYSLLESVGESGRIAHLLILIADFMMVLLYSIFLIGANYNTFHYWVKNCVIISVITFFPTVLALIQIGEISVLAIMITHFQNRFEGAARLANSLTEIKYYLTPVCFLLPIIGLCVKMVMIFLQKRMKNSEI